MVSATMLYRQKGNNCLFNSFVMAIADVENAESWMESLEHMIAKHVAHLDIKYNEWPEWNRTQVT